MREKEAFYSLTIKPLPFECKLKGLLFLFYLQVGQEGQSGLELGIFLPPFLSGSTKFPGGQVLVNQFILSGGLFKKNRVLQCVSKRFVSSPTLQEAEGIFLRYLLWESSQAPKGKSHNILTVTYDQVPLEFLTLRYVQTGPPAIHQFQFRCSSHSTR